MCLEQAKGEGRCAETWEGLGVAEVLGYLAAFGARDEEEACTTVAADTSEDSLDHCTIVVISLRFLDQEIETHVVIGRPLWQRHTRGWYLMLLLIRCHPRTAHRWLTSRRWGRCAWSRRCAICRVSIEYR